MAMSPITYLLKRDAYRADWWDDQSYIFYQSDALADFLEDLAESEVYENLREAIDDRFTRFIDNTETWPVARRH